MYQSCSDDDSEEEGAVAANSNYKVDQDYFYDQTQKDVWEARAQSKEQLFENAVSRANAPYGRKLKRNTYFIKKGFCLISRHIPACEELNRINVYLKKASQNGLMHAQFEIYLARLLFQVPLPLRRFPTTL